MTPQEIRLAAGLSTERCAVAVRVKEPLLVAFEADPTNRSITPRVRAKLEAGYAKLADFLAASAPGGTIDRNAIGAILWLNGLRPGGLRLPVPPTKAPRRPPFILPGEAPPGEAQMKSTSLRRSL